MEYEAKWEGGMAKNMLPGTFNTTEQFDAKTTRDSLDVEVEIRILAGAIGSSYKYGDGDKIWTLTTQWNVIGHNEHAVKQGPTK